VLTDDELVRVYRAAVTEYLAMGGHERGTQFGIFKDLPTERTHHTVRTVMRRYILRKGRISGLVDGRICDVEPSGRRAGSH
jgi:hypothetical protein